jgi:hypothetical protein
MATLSQTVAKGVRVYEAEVTLPTASGTVTAVSIPANCMVLAAGAVITEACAGSSAHVADLSIGLYHRVQLLLIPLTLFQLLLVQALLVRLVSTLLS